ncbi:MAG: hypothetical protein JWR21_4468 [Herminiimonas sp.]|nr:hypothetical protein [Herminiimonas sp.]
MGGDHHQAFTDAGAAFQVSRLLRKQLGNCLLQPYVARVCVVSLMPMLLYRVGR